MADAAKSWAWAPVAESPPERLVRLQRYPTVQDRPEGPCTHHECRYHLAHRGYWEHVVAPNRDCSLDVANEGPHTLDEVATALGVSSERIRQLEQQAFEALRLEPSLRQFYDEDELPDLARGRRRRDPT